MSGRKSNTWAQDWVSLFLSIVALALSPPAAGGQDSSRRPDTENGNLPRIQAERLAGSIHLDGRLEENAWQAATPATDFTQLDPFEGRPGSQATEVRVLYDDDAIYVGAWMEDGEGPSTRLGRRDAWLLDSDWLTVSLDSYDDNRTGYKFQVNPSGVRSDEALSGGQDRRGDDSWDPVWEAATHRTETGWGAELRIPFSQLRFRNAEVQSWGIQITRDIARNREKTLFSFTPKDERAGIARYGHLEGLRGIQQSRGLELLPYTLGRAEYVQIGQNEDVGFDNPFRDGSDFFYGVGMDLKYRLSSNLTLDATLNPDFGQVEVDPAVVNLTAFETRFQEKRPFFVEGAGIFSFGGGGGRGGPGGGGGGGGFFGGGGGGGPGGGPTQLLYSRRIGARPPGYAPSEAAYSDVPDQSTILGAAKLTGRTSNGWSLGLMEAVTGREMAEYVDEDRVRGESEVAPLSNYLVGRIRKDFREGQSAVGVLGTAVNRELGDPTMAEELRASAYTGGLDFSHEWDDRSWALTGYLAGSRIAGEAGVIEDAQTSSARYFQRPDASHVDLDPLATTLTGYTGSLELRRVAGLHWRGGVEFKTTSPGFEVNDLGFQTAADRREAEFRIEYQENRPGDVFRQWNVSISPQTSWNYDGDRLDTRLSLRSRFTFLNYLSINPSFTHEFESLDDRLTRGGPVAIQPSGNSASLWVMTDFTKPYSGMLSYRHSWDAAGGSRTSYTVRLGLKPSSTWELTLGPNLSINESAAQYVSRVEDPLAATTFGERYVFADLEQTTLSMETRLNVTFTPDLTLELFAQPFLASGDYGTLKELRAPRTFDFDRYGIDVGDIEEDEDGDFLIDPDGSGPAEEFTISDRDFNRVSLRGTAVVRWEWRPGSTLFLVWQQSRSDYITNGGHFDLSRETEAMFRARPDNIFMFKATYWIGS